MGARPGDAAPVRAVVFDAGGVLLHPHFDWIVDQAAGQGLRLAREQLHRAYYAMICAVDLDASMDRRGMAVSSGAIRSYLMRQLLGAAGVAPADVERVAPVLAGRAGEVFARESDIFHFAMPGRRAQLEQLRDAGFALAVASNNDGALDSQLEHVGLIDLFSVRLDSAIEGVAKPDPELLLRAARALALAPAACLYVGDIDRVDGAAARAAGMRFALLDPLGQPRPGGPLIIGSLDEIPALVAGCI